MSLGVSKKLDFPTALLHPRHWLTWLGVAAFAPLAWLPWRTRRWLGMRIGTWIYQRNHKRRQVVLTNLRLCFPAWDEARREQLTKQHFQEYACALLDYSLLFFRPRGWLYQRVKIQGGEHIDQAIAANQNVILLVAHSVWLEFAGMGMGQSYRLQCFYKPFRNAVINWLVTCSRAKDAESLAAREEGMRKLVRALESGCLLFFLPDEDHGNKHSVFVPFFSELKATLTTPMRLSKLGNAKAIPVMAYFDSKTGDYRIQVNPPLDNFSPDDPVEAATTMNAALQNLIADDPKQYMWTLKLFRTRPAHQKSVY